MGDQVLYFIKLKNDLDRNFFVLARLFNDYSVKLIPINFNDFEKLNAHRLENALIIVDSVQARNKLRSIRRRFFDFLLKQGRARIFDVSTFSPWPRSRGEYFHYPLPVDGDRLVYQICFDLYKAKSKENEQWPGGKRASLPPL